MYILKLSYKDDNGVFHEGEYFSGFGASYVSNYEISEPVLESEVNSVGHFSFTIYQDHPLYKFIDRPKSILEIVRYGKNEPLFIGRMAECTTGLYNEKNVVFESELAFLLDSVRTNLVSAQSYAADRWLDKILSFHNDHSGNFGSVYTDNIQRKFEPGKVSEKFKNESFSIPENELSGTLSTLEIISKLFLQKYGGVIKIRHENGSNLIDWLDEDDIPVLSQKIVLSENLLDIQKTKNADEIVTAIRPIGENTDSQDGKSEPLNLKLFEVPANYYDPSGDVKQVIDSKKTGDLKFTDTLYSQSLVNKYGWIQREVKFDGVTNKTGLSKAAVSYLLGISQSESISISAVDLASASSSADEFRAGDIVVVNSQIHGMESRKMIVQSVSADLSDPTRSEITLGSKAASITSQIGGTVSSVSFSGGFSGGTGRYDPEGSALAALSAAKKYTDEKSTVKVDKIAGKGLSTNDYTTAEKNKLAGLSNYDDTAVKADISTLKAGKADKSDVYTKTETDGRITSKISEVVAGAPEDFDTLKEMSDWISGHEDSAAAMNTTIQANAANITALKAASASHGTQIANADAKAGIAQSKAEGALTQLDDKVDKIEGMGLSENNYTSLEKSKLALLTNYNDSALKTKIEALEEGKVDKAAGKVLSSNDYTTTEKEKLAGIAYEANKTVVDSSLSPTSTHPVQNKVISAMLTSVNNNIKSKADLNHTHNYAGSSSAGGSANSAEKLAAARTINGVSFDGSANITIPRSVKHVHAAYGTEGTAGYVKICAVKVTGNYANHPIRFTISQRSVPHYDIVFMFASAGNTDPDVSQAYYVTHSNTKPNVYYVKSAASTWDIYIRKVEIYDHIYVLDYQKADGHEGVQYKVTWTNDLVTTLPNGYVTFSNGISHTHNYAGSSSAGGSATSAEKLATARTINGVSFDGSANITIPISQEPVILYDSGTVTNITSVTLQGLFTNNKLLHIMVTGSKYGTRPYLLPITSNFVNGDALIINKTDGSGQTIEKINFLKAGDSTLSWFDIQASGAEKYTRIVITKIF